MASTDAVVRTLTAQDLPGCLALSRAANWNQNEVDWRMMLDLGQGWGIEGEDADGSLCLAASIVVIPYAGGESTQQDRQSGAEATTTSTSTSKPCAWVSMVLVLPAFRRLGHASRLLQHALAWLQERDMTAVLDATPDGYPVYVQEGFAPTWKYRRYRRISATPQPLRAASARTRPLEPADWPAIAAIDATAFGADRNALLRRLANRLPLAARVAERHGRIVGYVFGRDGREACQIGPLVADDFDLAQALLDEALDTIAAPVYIDLADRYLALLPGLEARGFKLQRPFTRMVHGAREAPGDATQVVLVAGPELG